MATGENQTFTVDTTVPTETLTDNLTPEEQDSLAVGEEIQSEQENLLAGKYKSAEELEKAYKELESKLGEQTKEEPEQAETESESEEESKGYNDDGSVDYASVSEAYGQEISSVLEKGGIDPWAMGEEFHNNQGQYTPEMVSQLTKAGFSEEAVKSYFAGVSAEMGYSESVPDISDAQISGIQQQVGGEESYKNMVAWAQQNLSNPSIEAFDNIITTGTAEQIALAVSGLKAQYENATGYEGTMYTGKAPTNNRDVFRSQAELVAAMSDKRYDNDPAYRQDVIEKLDRSNLEF